MTRQLDKANQIATLAATVAIEEIFARVDIERRPGFRVQGTKSDELGAVSGGPGGPVLLPQIIEQRRSVEESGTRLGSLSVGVASSQEQCSTTRRRNA